MIYAAFWGVFACLLDPVHEPAIGQLREPRTGSDTDDPQGAKIAFLEFPSDVTVFKRLLDRFLRGAMQLALGEEKALRQGECFLAALTPLGTTFNSRHVLAPYIYGGSGTCMRTVHTRGNHLTAEA
jgi:hypothetical protein